MIIERLGPIADAVSGAMADLKARNAVRRALDGDHTLWQDDPTEVSDRLGWLHSPAEMQACASDLELFGRKAVADGFSDAVVLGMGGSSLFPEVMARTFDPSRLRLRVLDTTDPDAIRRVADSVPSDQTLFVAASKSGTTVETLSHLAFFWERIRRPEQFVVITDPGSPLGASGIERGFRRVFENRPDIGGRYSALSYFGLVPAALVGVDLARLLGGAARMRAEIDPRVAPSENSGLRLGAILGGAAKAGRDKLTLVVPEEVASFGDWLEQLIAESTGKRGTGIVPVVGEAIGAPEVYGEDRLFVSLGRARALDALAAAGHPVVELPFGDRYDLGAEALRWEFATAMAGAVLGINPFDQPNVAEAKEATAEVLRRGLPPIDEEPLPPLLDQVRPGDYLALQAYVDPGSDVVERLESARMRLRDRLRVATTLGIGPRFLHSTGQLHKGGPPTGVFVQMVSEDRQDVAIPDSPFGFATLKQAQAAGDYTTLRSRGLRVERVRVDDVLREAT